ncbi:MAG: hypothetical protein ABI680_06010 [Chthoniobacteraceae bacterium]
MTTRARKIFRISLILFVIVAVTGGWGVRRVAKVAAIQDALERDWEINFNDGALPSALPTSVDCAAENAIIWMLGPPRETLYFAEKANRETIWQERFRALFRGRITVMEIYYPGRMRDDLGSALAQFPNLRHLEIHKPDFSDNDWPGVFAGLHRLHQLEELEIGSYELRDSSIRGLANQQSVRQVSITIGKLSTECVETFRRLPRLTKLTFGSTVLDDGHDENGPPLRETQNLIRKALPGVKVVFD